MLGSALMLGLVDIGVSIGASVGDSVGPVVGMPNVGEALGPLHAARPSDTTAARIRNSFFKTRSSWVGLDGRVWVGRPRNRVPNIARR